MVIKWIKAHMKADTKEHMKEHTKEHMKKNTNTTVHLVESTRALSNPGCGWYHLYSFNLAEDSFLYIACEEEELVLLRIDIHAFRSSNQIPQEALERADRIFSFFAQHGKGIILRIVYDTDGRGMEHEPSQIAFVKNHMMQLGAVIKAHAGEILVHQGLFVGSWGEMHSSKFLVGGRMEELASTLVQATDGTCPIAVRKPAQLRSLKNLRSLRSFDDPETNLNQFTLFNDGIFGSETDLGTYDMPRQDELDWQQRQMQRSFCGGEALGGMDTAKVSGETDLASKTTPSKTALSETNPSETNPSETKFSFPILDWQRAAADLAQMHVSYLNSVYRQELLDDWKTQRAVWNDEEMSGYDYIGRHLGYRFTVTCVHIINEPIALQITIRNTGFANLCEEAVCKLILVKKEAKEAIIQTIELDSDARTWDSGMDTVIECNISQEIQQTRECQNLSANVFFVFLQLTRKRDGRILEFANEEYDRHFGGVLLKTF